MRPLATLTTCSRRAPAFLLLLAFVTAACAYPRRSTALSPVREATLTTMDAPADIWRLRVSSATVPRRSRGDLGWDGSDGAPDPFVRIYRDGELVWESETIQDSYTPEWSAYLPNNLRAPRDAVLRFEVWDRDEVGADPIGIATHRGLPPNVVPGADARILLEGGAQLSLHLEPPLPHRGVGIRLYEVRDGELRVVEVEPFSPAARAGIEPGDSIIRIGDQTVSALGDRRAPGALSMSGDHRETLRVRGPDGRERDVQMDRGYTWIVM